MPVETVSVEDLVEGDFVQLTAGSFMAIADIDELPKSRTLWFVDGRGAVSTSATKRRSSTVAIAARGRDRPQAVRRTPPDEEEPEPALRVGSGADLQHVERLPSFVNEGHLYRSGEQHFLVFNGESDEGWDACPSRKDRFGKWAFGDTLVRAHDREMAVAKLRTILDSAEVPRDGW